jgi:hypothetical protein
VGDQASVSTQRDVKEIVSKINFLFAVYSICCGSGTTETQGMRNNNYSYKHTNIAVNYLPSTFVSDVPLHNEHADVNIIDINPLKPCGNYMYHLLYKSVIVRSVFMGLV